MTHQTPRGYYCTRCPRHDGPCVVRPWFWNLRGLVARVRH